MKVYKSDEIKNIALIGGAKSGKTTLVESMLFDGGIINRMGTIENKNTVSDYREIELYRQNSVSSSILYTEFEDKKINIIDTPGFVDFIGEVIYALNVTDTSFIVVNAQNGIEVGTEISWRYTNKNNNPVVFVINQLDHEKANFEETINQLKQQFGGKVTLVQYPVNCGESFNEIIDIIKMKMLKFSSEHGKYEETDIPDSEKSKAEALRATLIEAAAESSEELMEKFFENDTLSLEELQQGLKSGLVNRSFCPVFCVSAKNNTGVTRLLEFISNFLPCSSEMPAKKTVKGKELKCNPKDNASALVFKTSVEQHLGEVSFLKVYSGEITEGMDMINGNTGTKEKISQLLLLSGKNRNKVEKAVAGDIVATIKLKDTNTNNTLNSVKNSSDIIEPVVYPEPVFRTAIKPVKTSDDEKLNIALNSMHKTDPTLIVEYSRELRQIILQGQGELHINTVKWYLNNIYNIDIEVFTPKIPYRETITKSARAMYRHKKQSGGAGQFGEVFLMIEPYYEGKPDQKEFSIRRREKINLDWGGKLIFNNCIVGGSIDQRFMPAILKGIMEKIEQGPLTGSYARDIIVNVYDGKMHPVDSNEISFRLAGRNAFKEAFKKAGSKILEPVYDIEVIVPEEKMGDVMTDLQSRRSIIMGMNNEGNYQIILAKVPLSEMNKYSITLSSLTNGRATFSLKFDKYVQVPSDIQVKLLKEYEEQEKE